MAQKLTASMPENMDLAASYTVQWAAVDPTTGAAVSGVVVKNGAMLVTQVTPGSADQLAFGPFVPAFVPIPADEINAEGT